MPRPTNLAELRAFLANRAKTRPENEVPTVATDGTVATIRLYEPIDSWGGWWGLSAEDFAEAIDSLPANVTEIRLLINSPGGDVFDGVAIANVLAAHPARVVAVVQGIAASAATFVAMRANELVMNPGSMLMIHDASAGVYGWAEDMRQMADLLDTISNNIADMYTAKAGGTSAEWRERMQAETWYTAESAVTAGLADRVGDAVAEDAPTDVEPEPDPPAPFMDRFVWTANEARSRLGLPEVEVVADPTEIASTTEDDADAQSISDTNTRNRINAMRLALVTA